MRKISNIVLILVIGSFSLTGCTQQLDKKEQSFDDNGVSYEFKLPSGWKADQKANKEYGLQTSFSAEDTKSNSYLYITTTSVNDVKKKNFGEQTREKLKERYHYKNVKDIYMKKITVGSDQGYKYTLNTIFKEKSVWAHFYYIWTKNGFVQLTFYSADDNLYKKRSEQIDASIETFKETHFDKNKAKEEEEGRKEEEGDIVTIESKELKFETTAVRKLTVEGKELLAIRYTFTNLALKNAQPSIWKNVVTAKQNGVILSLGELPEKIDFLDVKELDTNQTKSLKHGEHVESVVLYNLLDESPVELNFSQEIFPGTGSVRVVVPR